MRATTLAIIGLGAAVIFVMTRIGEPSRAAHPIRGIDVSHHQGRIDWDTLSDSDLAFVFMKASEGRDHRDRRFRENWLHAGRAGFARGAYHYFTFCSSGTAQADNFLAVAPPSSGSLPPVVDVEFAGNCTQRPSIDAVREELMVFLRRIEQAHERKPMLYVTRQSYRRIVAGRFFGYPIWIRNVVWKPWLWGRTWTFWQYTDQGSVAGIRGPVDLDVFNGNRAKFARLTKEASADKGLEITREKHDEAADLGDDQRRHMPADDS